MRACQKDKGIRPERVKGLGTGYPGYHIHGKRVDVPLGQCFYQLFVLFRIDERNERASVLDAPDLFVEQGRPDLEHDVGFGKQVFTRCECRTGLLVIFIQKLGVRPGIVFDEHLRETFLAQEGDVLWCEGDAAFVWVDFSRNSHPQG